MIEIDPEAVEGKIAEELSAPKRGQLICVSLPEDQTTGRRWQREEVPDGFELVREKRENAKRDTRGRAYFGTEQRVRFVFRAGDHRTDGTLVLSLRRPFDDGGEAERTVRLQFSA